MISSIKRYTRAFVVALKFTLRGQKPPLLRARDQYPQLSAWFDQTITLANAVESAASARGIDPAALTIHSNKRDVSLATIVATIRFHAEREYPYLLVQGNEYGPLTIQATNMNDRYLIMQLAQTVDSGLKAEVDALSEHLAALPAED
jgi:hypothetical protein